MVSLPAELLADIGPILGVERPPQGDNFTVDVLTTARGRFVLKRGDTPAKIAELEREGQVLTALRDHVPFVAQPVAQDAPAGAFLFTYLDGQGMTQTLQRADTEGRHRLMREFARALRRVHAWTPALPRPDNWLAWAVDRAAAHIAAGTIPNPIEHSYGLWDGADPRQVLKELQRWYQGGPENETVFCHGDYCLPNVLVQGETVTGLIDWSAGGYADRRFDLATALYTIRRNLGHEDFARTFLSAYGYGDSAESLRYFEALYNLL